MDFLKAKPWKGQVCKYAQHKLDGHRVIISKDKFNRINCVTRIGTRLDLSHWGWYLSFLRLMPPESSVDGELWVPRQPASYIKTALKARDPALRFTAFAIPVLKHMQHWMMPLEEVEALCISWNIRFAPYEFYDPEVNYLTRAEKLGIEGWVFKDGNMLNWYKYKIEKTIDCVVTGFKDGDGKYLGLVGALKVSVFNDDGLVEIARVSGMDDMTRYEIDEEEDLMRVCEVRYQYVGSKGRLRHPRFVRWRDDKRAEECTIDQL